MTTYLYKKIKSSYKNFMKKTFFRSVKTIRITSFFQMGIAMWLWFNRPDLFTIGISIFIFIMGILNFISTFIPPDDDDGGHRIRLTPFPV